MSSLSFWQRRNLKAIFFWPFCIAASRSTDYQFVAMPRPIKDFGLDEGFRNRDFIINRPTEAVKRSELTSQNNQQNLKFVYRTEATVLEGRELIDWAQRKLFNTVGFVTLESVESEDLAQTIINLAAAEVASHLALFLTDDNSKEFPVIMDRCLYSVTFRKHL